MIWMYRVFRDNQGRYSIREVFCEQDHTIINYSKTPVALVGASFEELMQLVQWFKDAFDLPILSLEEVEAQVKQQETQKSPDRSKNIPLSQVIMELTAEADPISQ